MIKKFCVVFLIILLASCSNLDVNEVQNSKALEDQLSSKIELIKKDIKLNSFESLENALDIPIKGGYIVSELNKIDMTKSEIYSTKPKIKNRTAENVIGLRFGEEIFYFNVGYKYRNGDWRITKFIEGRWEVCRMKLSCMFHPL